MTKNVKVVLIGAGSAQFAPSLLGDFFQCKKLFGSTLTLLDINREKLNLIGKFAKVLMKEAKADYKIQTTLNRKEALEDERTIE